MKCIVSDLFNLGKTEYIWVELSIMDDLTHLQVFPGRGGSERFSPRQAHCILKQRCVPQYALLLDSSYPCSVFGHQ